MNLPPFPTFDPDIDTNSNGQRWRKWSNRFDNFMEAMRIKDDGQKRALLLHYAGEQTNDTFDTLPNTGTSYNAAMAAITNYYAPLQNREFETYNFRQLKQLQGETSDQFCTRLRKTASLCAFTDEEREIKSQIITGCLSNKVRKHALQTPDLKLKELLAYCRINETAEKQAIEISTTINQSVRSIRKETSGISGYNKQKTKSTENKHHNKRKCKFCGNQWHNGGLNECRAQGKTCRACGKMNHFESVCMSRDQNKRSKETNNHGKKEEVRQITIENENTDYVYLTNNNKYNNTIMLGMRENKVPFIIDTGATVDILNHKEFLKLQPTPKIKPPISKIYGYMSKTPMNVLGIFKAEIKYNTKKFITTMHVIKGNDPSIIGRDSSIGLGLIQFTYQMKEDITDKIKTKYPKLFDGIGKHNQTKITLHINQHIKPIRMKHRRIPFHVRPKLEKEIKDLLDKEIIEPVPTNEPTPWVSAVVVRPKKANSNEVRICIDMREANRAISRERHLTPTLEDVLCDLNGAQIFSKLDLRKGYHQLEIDEKSRHITTFSTHLGLFRYRRLNFGITSAAEIFQKTIAETIEGISGAINISDDILIYGQTDEQHEQALQATLRKLQEAGLTLNEGKCLFYKTHLNFLGHIFSHQGIAADPNRTRDIIQMKPPLNAPEVRSFIGMINFCLRFIPNLATTITPLRELTKNNTKWKWDTEQQTAFDKTKDDLTKTINLQYFDQNKQTEIWTDASPIGLGAILIQVDKQGKHYPLAFASHALNPTETRYSQIEREALAITWAINKFHLYLYGAKFKVITDHQPLIPLFNNPRSVLSARLERWRLKLQPYEFEVIYMPGKFNPADFMSRHPPTSTTNIGAGDISEEYINFIQNHTIPKSITLQEIQDETIKDKVIQEIITSLKTGKWPENNKEDQENQEMKQYRKIQFELSTNKEGNILLRGARLIIPKTLQKRAVQISHLGHQGISKTKALLREKTWFMGIDKMVEKEVKNCLMCAASQDNHNKPPLIPTPLPEHPWAVLNIDHKGPLPTGQYLLTMVDQYSRFPIIETVSTTSAKANIPKLRKIFSIYGIPATIITDNGPPFNSREFTLFMDEIGCQHHRITPLWPQANGGVERLHRTINKALQIAQSGEQDWESEMNRMLMDYRSTPHSTTGLSPYELLFGYKMNTRLPEIRNMNNPEQQEEVKIRDEKKKGKGKQYHDNKYSKNKTKIGIGDKVLIKHDVKLKSKLPFKTNPYIVTKIAGTQISAECENHKITRNESFMKPVPNENETTSSKDKTQITTEEETSKQPATPTPPESELPSIEDHTHTNDDEETPQPKYNLRRNRRGPNRLIEEI